jgi:hypothetical protein
MTHCLNPRCGSYHVTDKPVIVNPKSLRVFPSHPFWEGIGGGFICGILGIVINFFATPFLHPQSPTAVQSLVVMVIDLVLFVTVAGFFVLPVWGVIQLIRKWLIGFKVHRYECSTCGYKWVWPEGAPVPQQPATYDPDPKLFAEDRKRQAVAV